jgi:hypothetical protein
MMMNAAAKGVSVLVASMQICLVDATKVEAATKAPATKVVRNRIVTVEVLREIRALRKEAAKQKANGHRRAYGYYPKSYEPKSYRKSYGPKSFGSSIGDALAKAALAPSDFPSLTVNVAPPEPKNFIVAINRTPYPRGARKFWVTWDKTLITVTRAGKYLCETTLDFSVQNSAEIDCPSASGSTEILP